MATTRIKDISKTTTDLASDTYGVFDGATNGTQKMSRNDMYADWAAAYTAAPTTYKLAPLNSGTNKIDATYLPVSGDTPKGEWNASTNSPYLADGSGTAGDYYDVTTAGSQDLGSGSTITFTVGDVVKYNGSTWYKIDSVANFLDGYSTAATSRAALEVNSVDEDAEATGTKLVGPALYFDGSNDHLAIASDSKFGFTDGTSDLPLSIECWLRLSELKSSAIIARHPNSTTAEWELKVESSGKITFRLFTTGGTSNRINVVSLTALEAEKWYHICGTYDGSGNASGLKIAINGSDDSDTPYESGTYAGMSETSQAVWIGRSSSSGYFHGHIKDVKIFNRELTATEVAQLARGNDLGFSEEWGGGTATSGTLTIGKRYRLRDWITGDDFTNVGAGSNADGVEFVATGTTPTTWTNSSVVESIGTLADFRAENFDEDTGKLYDLSSNAFVGTSANLPTLTGRAYPVYETGTWTPSITFGGGSTGITYTTQEGLYTRVGNTVWVSAYVLLSAKGSDTGTALVNGLPFTASNTAASSQSFVVGNAANAANLTSAITAYATDNGTTINLVDWGATGSAVLDDTNFAATTALSITGTYQIQ